MEYHVYQNGPLQENCFRTISEAVPVLCPGDILTIHEGVYRERVTPVRGGTDDAHRIVFRGTDRENVTITGADAVTDWTREEGDVWKTVLDNRMFGTYNPYQEVLQGDWFDGLGRINHTGEVYIDGRSMYETGTLEDVRHPKPCPEAQDPEASRFAWYCESGEKNTVIWANFAGMNPLEHLVEINVRPCCFFPEETGIDYITVENLTLCCAATQWAPPTAFQSGLIGPNWSKGWIIQNNIIRDSKCSGISLGKCHDFGENEWSRLKIKHGTQRQRETVFRALHGGWSKETVGSHIVRGNLIHHCEQTGICGHMGGAFSLIEDNIIRDIHVKRLFAGAEIAGIKLHAALDTQIVHNEIINCFRGIWMDWETQGSRITRNILAQNQVEDLLVEVSHGPYVVDHNLFLSDVNLSDYSQGGAFLHNLFTGKFIVETVPIRFTHYHFPHETAVSGMMVILGGDNRFIQNLFVKKNPEAAVGLSCYNHYPTPAEAQRQYDTAKTVPDYLKLHHAMYCEGNLYFNGAVPYREETGSHVMSGPCTLDWKDWNGIVLTTDIGQQITGLPNGRWVCSDSLGTAFESEQPYDNPDGTCFYMDHDVMGEPVTADHVIPGPFGRLPDCLMEIYVGILG